MYVIDITIINNIILHLHELFRAQKIYILLFCVKLYNRGPGILLSQSQMRKINFKEGNNLFKVT